MENVRTAPRHLSQNRGPGASGTPEIQRLTVHTPGVLDLDRFLHSVNLTLTGAGFEAPIRRDPAEGVVRTLVGALVDTGCR